MTFNREKIVKAIKKAFISVGESKDDEYCEKIASEIAEEAYFKYNYSPTVEQI